MLKALAFNSLKAHHFQAVGFKYQLAPSTTRASKLEKYLNDNKKGTKVGAVQARPRLESACFQTFNLMKMNLLST